MIHGIIDFILTRGLGGSTEFERYCTNVQSSNGSGLLTPDEARKDYQAMLHSRIFDTVVL